MKNILLTICARAKSKGIKGKNTRLLLGKPLIYYTIKQAIEWGKATRIVVSTDSKEIAKIAEEYRAEVPFLRPKELALDTCAKLPVIRHALLKSEKIYNECYEIVVDLDVTAPIRQIKDLDNCLEIFLKYKPKVLFSVVFAHKNPYFNMVEEKDDGRITICKESTHQIVRRQDAPKVYDMNASIYFFDRKYICDPANITAISDNPCIYVMDEIASIDIDRETDFKFVEFLLREGIVTL